MSGAVPHTSTYALTNVTMPYVVVLTDRGWRDSLRADRALALGLSTYAGGLVSGPVAQAHGLEHVELADILAWLMAVRQHSRLRVTGVLLCAMRTMSPLPDMSPRAKTDLNGKRPAEFVQSLDRGLAVIRAFSAERPELTLSEVARETGLSRAAARRFLLTLESLSYVGSNGRQFFLKPRVLDLGYAYLSSFSASEIAQSHLEQLSTRLHESCSASVLDGGDIIYTARAATNRIMTIGLSVGRRLPAFATSMGRVLLSALSPEELEAYLADYDRPAFTSRTVTDEAELRNILDSVRTRGWAMIDQELEDGVRSVAAPVHDAGRHVVAAVNVSAHASRVTVSALQRQFLPELLATAEAISRDLTARR